MTEVKNKPSHAKSALAPHPSTSCPLLGLVDQAQREREGPCEGAIRRPTSSGQYS